MSLTKTIKNTIKKRPSLIVTPIIEAYLERTPELTLNTPEEEALFLKLMRPSPNSERAGRFGASSRGTCKRRQVFGFLGMMPAKLIDPRLQLIFWDGKLRHIRWQLMLLQSGAATKVEHRWRIDKYRLKVSLDASHVDRGYFVEVKGMYSYAATMTEINPHHNLQMHTCMLASGTDTAIYIPEEKGSQEWREIVVHRDEDTIKKVKRELIALNQAVDYQELPDVKNECRKKVGEYKSCPYAILCLEHEKAGDNWPVNRQWEHL